MIEFSNYLMLICVQELYASNEVFLIAALATGNSRSLTLGRREYGTFLTGGGVDAIHVAGWLKFGKKI